MILFKKLRYKNFLSTGNYYTEILLNRTSNTLVIGANGAGKSSMLDALTFSLFGRAFRDVNKPSLVNSINQKDCLVEVEFSVGIKEYKIVRGIKPNVFEIWCDNQLVNQDASVRDYQDYLEKFVLKLNYKSFTQIVILGSASFVPFMQLTTSDRRSIIEDLLDIQIFSVMNSVLKQKVTANKDAISTNKSEIELISQKHDIQEGHINQLKKNNEEKLEQYEKEVIENNSQISTIEQKIVELNTEIKELNDSIASKSSVETKLKSMYQLESKIETKITNHKSSIKFFKENDDCPVCRQSIAEDFKNEQINHLGSKVSEAQSGLKELEIKLTEFESKIQSFQAVSKKIQSLQVQVASNNTTITQINRYIAKLQQEIFELRNTKNNLKDATEKLDELLETKNQLENDKKTLIEEKSYLEAAALLLKDTGIKTKIIKQYIPVINKTVNKYLAALDFYINFSFDESFKETIKSRHRDDFTYASFSEGEKQRIDMALMLTWRAIAKMKNSTNTNLLILDEVFDSSLDNNGTEYLMSILHALEDCNLFVISHKGDILQDKFRSIIRFEKKNNFSRMVK